MAPLPPTMLKLEDAVKMTAVALEISEGLALDCLLDALCDGAIYADAIFRSAAGPPNRLTISPANWQMHKYNGAQLHYEFVEIATIELIKWLRLDDATAPSDGPTGPPPDAPPPVARSGAPGRPTSMFLVIEEAKRRIAAGRVEAPDKKTFAKELEDWIRAQPGQPHATAKTIAQNPEITNLYNDLKRARNSSPK